MAEIGYALSSEEHEPRRLAGLARGAERAGFEFALISDHYHPWVDRQGSSPFVWSTLGAIAVVTQDLRVGTGVTCPLIRMHPAVVAQASATVATMMPGRFFLGVGTGENLNEHVVGEGWPEHQVRLEMFKEAIAVIRELWEGKQTSHHGDYYDVENARIYTIPEQPPELMVAAAGPKTLDVAGSLGDGLIALAPDSEMIDRFERSGGKGKPKYGQVHVCWGESESEAVDTAHEWWPNAALPGELTSELALPSQFEAAAKLVDRGAVAERIVCGPDPDRHVAAIQEFIDAGYDHVYVHQVGPEQDGFFGFYEEKVLPNFAGERQADVVRAPG